MTFRFNWPPYIKNKQRNIAELLKALEYFSKSYAIEDQSTVSICGIGRTLAVQHDPDNALKYFAEALTIDPKDPYTIYYMGQTWQDKGDYYRAMHYYTEALKIDPDL